MIRWDADGRTQIKNFLDNMTKGNDENTTGAIDISEYAGGYLLTDIKTDENILISETAFNKLVERKILERA